MEKKVASCTAASTYEGGYRPTFEVSIDSIITHFFLREGCRRCSSFCSFLMIAMVLLHYFLCLKLKIQVWIYPLKIYMVPYGDPLCSFFN